MIVKREDGTAWRLGPPSRTSDGFVTTYGILIDEDGNDVTDEMGIPVGHTFFLGQA